MMKSVIYHIDVNSAFLSWTAAHRVNVLGESLDLRSIPSVVAGNVETRHGIILAKSTPAKAFGVRTGEPLWKAQAKCPQLVAVPPDYALYVEQSRLLLALLRSVAPMVEQYSIDEAWADMSGTGYLYGDAVEAADRLRERIKRELGFTVNIGVSSNKLLAKMAGELRKPDQVHTLFPGELEEKLWPLPVRELFFVGAATERKLAYFGIHTIGELANTDPDFLRARFHKHGELIWNYANGRGDAIVSDADILNKGYGNSVTTARDVTDTLTAHRTLLSLCETVCMRMRRDRQSGRVVGVHIRKSDFHNGFTDLSHQRPLDSCTNVTDEIWQAACACFDELWDGRTPLRQLGVQVQEVGVDLPRQYTLFDRGRWDRREKLDAAVDAVRQKYGEDAIHRACFLHSDIAAMGGGLARERRTGITKPV